MGKPGRPRKDNEKKNSEIRKYWREQKAKQKKKKDPYSLFLTSLLLISFFLIAVRLPTAKGDITETLTFTALTSDGSIYYDYATSYSEAYYYTSGTVTTSYVYVGQTGAYFDYAILRGFLPFDTSGIPSAATINNATLSVYVANDYSDTDFNITVQSGQPTFPHLPLVASDYYYAWYSGAGGSRSTSEIGGAGYFNISLSSTGLTWLMKDGTTKFCLRSSLDISESEPADTQYVELSARESGDSSAPKLYVTYTVSTEGLYSYTFHGPYYDGGGVVSGSVNVTAYYPNSTIQTVTLTADGATPDVEYILSPNELVEITWNASSYYNYTRVIDFTGEAYYDVYIFIPETTSYPTYQYAFSVTDFYGMTSPFLQTSIFNGTTNNLVESRDLNISSTIYFTMEQYRTYQLTITCGQGTYVQQFLAENVFSSTIPILAGAFPVENTTLPTLLASRYNSSLITVTYSDSSYSTVWLSFTITHLSGTTTVLDYSSNATGNSQMILWNGADADKSYTVNATALIGSTTYVWTIPVSNSAVDNPWLGLFDFLGQNTDTLPHYYTGWPEGMTSAQIAQLIGAAIITLFLGIGSFRNAGASCVMAWIAGGIMFAIGWWNGGLSQAGVSALPEFGLAGFLAILIAMHENKQQGAGLS